MSTTETISTADWPKERLFDPELYGNGNPATYGLPLELYARLREDFPCFKITIDHPMLIEECWVASRYEDIVAIDQDPDLWTAGGGWVNIWKFTPITPPELGGKPAMIIYDGERHAEHRAIFGPGFRPAAAQRLEEQFRATAVKVVDAAVAKGTFDFITDVAHLMPMKALGDVLGVPESDQARFFNYVDVFASPFDERVTKSFDDVFAALAGMWEYSLELCELRRREPAQDTMTIVAKACAAGQLDDAEVQGTVSLLASGAAESTRSALGHGMHSLLRNPDQMEWIRKRQDDLPATVAQEMIRVATPFTHLLRTATRDTELHGCEIKQGEQIAMMFGAGNFDPEGIREPEAFDLSRSPNPHLSFGRGPHACLGKHVAAFEMKVLLEEFLQRTRNVRLAGDVSYVKDNYTRGIYSLPITVDPA